ncbi:putative toxin-antitoxin system antitoxin component (TIGR02293 family) [Pseudomonas sp. SJZ080]|uniref:antitoxin Xre/MbcA/ParS toxin-binding domain-containing protein n=1 Tax=Pseudomonas sp. SJZ080 TaxID=2572888 RepID=UPI00119B8204|nr:antitoxin Xre/MbcA/ParS toxin-binding domain-containing protein [Pseudomonas sp. SJZ080]TWC55270.1 putative toxin-antitoxin system antitoxin component (TIGR02293 family) [Pseudomonas sp. SJZ080]
MFTDIFREDAYRTYRLRLEVILHIPIRASDQDIHDLIEAGFPASIVDKLCDNGIISIEARDLIIPLKTLKTRLMLSQRLTVDESDRLFRVAHITAMAGVLFGDSEKAENWLTKSKFRFSDKSPIAMLSTIQGTRRVEEMLVQVAEGLVF